MTKEERESKAKTIVEMQLGKSPDKSVILSSKGRNFPQAPNTWFSCCYYYTWKNASSFIIYITIEAGISKFIEIDY